MPVAHARTRYVVAMMDGLVIAWSIKLQPTVALSTIVEEEYMAVSSSAQEVAFFDNFSST
jgi:hypothetical protein